MVDNGSSERILWNVAGHKVCYKAWLTIMGVGNNRVRNITQSDQMGKLAPERDLQKDRDARDAPAAAQVDAFLEYMYQNLAEPLADMDVRAAEEPIENDQGLILPRDDDDLELSESNPILQADNMKERRFLPPGTVQDLYETFLTFSRPAMFSQSRGQGISQLPDVLEASHIQSVTCLRSPVEGDECPLPIAQEQRQRQAASR